MTQPPPYSYPDHNPAPGGGYQPPAPPPPPAMGGYPGPVGPPPVQAAPPKKSRTGLIVGVLLGVLFLLCGGGGAGVYFGFFHEWGEPFPYLASYATTEEPVPAGGVYVFDVPEDYDYDLCTSMLSNPMEQGMQTDGPPVGETGDNEDGTGLADCTERFEALPRYEYNEFLPVVTFYVGVSVAADETAAKTEFQDVAGGFEGQSTTAPQTGDEVAASVDDDETNRVVSMVMRSGNLTSYAYFAVYHGGYSQPDTEVLVNIMFDKISYAVANGPMTTA